MLDFGCIILKLAAYFALQKTFEKSQFDMVIHQFQPCVACGGTVRFFGTRNPYTYARCSQCQTIQLTPFPTDAELAIAYSDEYARSDHYGVSDPDAIFRLSEPFYQALLHQLHQANLPAGQILDFGCGWGGLCRYLAAHHYDYLGIDFPSESLTYCQQRSLNVSAQTLDDLIHQQRQFSAIVLNTVFEHLNHHATTLEQFAKLLVPGGVLIILIPTANLNGALAKLVQGWQGTTELPKLNTTFCPPWHTTIFSTQGMRRLLSHYGFRLERLVPSPSGRAGGLLGVIQAIATVVARTGFQLFGERWPLVLNHIFVCRVQS